MSLMDVANALVAGCREGRERENLEKLYAADCVSAEAFDNGNGREVQGIPAIMAKHDWFEGEMDVLDMKVSDPMPHGEDRFAVTFEMMGRDKKSGAEYPMNEIAIYTVTNGKISREEFFYAPPPG